MALFTLCKRVALNLWVKAFPKLIATKMAKSLSSSSSTTVSLLQTRIWILTQMFTRKWEISSKLRVINLITAQLKCSQLFLIRRAASHFKATMVALTITGVSNKIGETRNSVKIVKINRHCPHSQRAMTKYLKVIINRIDPQARNKSNIFKKVIKLKLTIRARGEEIKITNS